MLFALHQQVKASQGLGRAFADPSRRVLHRRLVWVLLQREWLNLFELGVDREAIADIYCYRYGGAVSFYQTAYALKRYGYGSGRQQMGHAIRPSSESGVEGFGFLPEAKDLTAHWTATAVQGLTLRIPGSWRVHLQVLAYRRLATRLRQWQAARARIASQS